MAQPLPTTAQPDASTVITRFCQHLEFFASHPPLEVSPLASGENNLNYYVRTLRGEYVLRRYPTETVGVCRQQELRCQHAAAAAGLAPAPLCLNNHQQLLISEYVSGGETLQLTPTRLLMLASNVARLHSLKVQTPLLAINQYLHKLMHNVQWDTLTPAVALYSALQYTATEFEQLTPDIVLCHMDLHQGNLLWAGERIWLLDFEYAQLADSSFDIAALSLHFALSKEQEMAFLARYYQQRRFVDNQSAQRYQQSLCQRLALAKILYSGFCWLWYQAQADSQAAAAQWCATLNTLLD